MTTRAQTVKLMWEAASQIAKDADEEPDIMLNLAALSISVYAKAEDLRTERVGAVVTELAGEIAEFHERASARKVMS